MSKLSLIAALFTVILLTGPSALASDKRNDDKKKDAPISVPDDYVSDGCTGFPNGTYVDCCVAHDEEYYVGGSWKQRWKSDWKLSKCVAAKPGFHHRFLGPMMWVAVRVMGVPWFKQPYSWGFGRREQNKKEKKGSK